MADDTADREVGEIAEYCRTQAGLLAGRVETMGEEARALLDEIDEGVADLRDRLADRPDDETVPASPETAPSSESVRNTDIDDTAPEDGAPVADLAEAESTLEEKQALVEATETRMRLFQELAASYLELAETLLDEYDAGDIDADEAARRVVSFEAEHDAPAYFEERETLVEVARRESDSANTTE